MAEATEEPKIAADTLRVFCAALFRAAGMEPASASVAADTLVEADLRGVDSHGVIRVPIYVERLLAGVIASRPVIRIARQTRSTAVVDGGNGMGQIVSRFAMQLAIDKARAESEPAFVSVFKSNHFGAAATYVEMAAAAEMIGFAYTIGGINHMVPWGGAEAMLGNNPFAVALPLPGEPSIVLDMACSVAARGKIMMAAKQGKSIPEGWAVDRRGLPTTDPEAALAGFVSPVGGAKGYALTLAIGLLSTMLSGAGFGTEVTHMYEDLEHPQNIGHLFGVLPISAFEDFDRYATRISKAAGDVRGVPRAPGVDRIFLPGEREAALLKRRVEEGVPIPPAVLAELAALAGRLGVDCPL
jgi:LDH2 family malate/lactate/ureidoglycolate dehydrogenase